MFYPEISLSSLIFSLSSLFLIPSLSLAIVKLLSVESVPDRSSCQITMPDRRSRQIGFLDRRGGEAGGAAEIGVVAGGQRCGDWRGDLHWDRRLVGLMASMEIGKETDVWWCWHGGRFLGLVAAFGWLGCYGFAGFVVGTWWVLFCFFLFWVFGSGGILLGRG